MILSVRGATVATSDVSHVMSGTKLDITFLIHSLTNLGSWSFNKISKVAFT